MCQNWALKNRNIICQLPIVQSEVNLDYIKSNPVCNSFSPHVHRLQAKNKRYGKWGQYSFHLLLIFTYRENQKQITANIEIVCSEKEAQDSGKQTMPLLWLCPKENETKCNLQAVQCKVVCSGVQLRVEEWVSVVWFSAAQGEIVRRCRELQCNRTPHYIEWGSVV